MLLLRFEKKILLRFLLFFEYSAKHDVLIKIVDQGGHWADIKTLEGTYLILQFL